MSIDENTINSILSCLESTSVRDRSKGAEKLKEILYDCSNDIPQWAFQEFLKILIDFYEFESLKCQKLYNKIYANGESINESKSFQTSVTKTIEASNLIRIFIEKLAPRFSNKNIGFILPCLLSVINFEEITFDSRPNSKTTQTNIGSEERELSADPVDSNSGGNFQRQVPDEVLTNLSYSVLSLIKTVSFHLKKTNSLWIKSMNTSLFSLNKLLDKQVTISPNVNNWLAVLLELLKQDSVELFTLSKELINTVYRFVSYHTRETSNSTRIIELVNKTVLRTHLSNLNCLKLIKPTVSLISKLHYFKNDKLCLEIAYFNIFISNLLPRLEVSRSVTTGIIDWFSDLEVHLQIFLSAYYNKKYEFDIIFQDLQPSSDSVEWITFLDFQFSHSSNAKDSGANKWLLLSSFSNLLTAYFIRLEQQKIQSSNSMSLASNSELGIFNEINIAYKKPKYSYELLTGCFSNADNLFEFIVNTLDDTSIENSKIFGLQMLAFHATKFNFDVDLSFLVEKVILLMKDDALYKWCCLSIISIFSCKNFNVTVTQFENLLKLGLSKVMNDRYSEIACIMVHRMCVYQTIPKLEKTVLYRLYDIIDLSIINGPLKICRSSLNFWKSLYRLAPLYKSSTEETILDKIYQWLDHKWNSFVSASTHIDMFSFVDFILWLEQKPTRPHSHRLQKAGFDISYYSDWTLFKSERDFLYRPIKPKRKKFAEKHDIICDVFEKSVVRKLYDKMNDTMNEIHKLDDVLIITNLIISSMYLIDNCATESLEFSDKANLLDSITMACKYIKLNDFDKLIYFLHVFNSANLMNLPKSISMELSKFDIVGKYLAHYNDFASNPSSSLFSSLSLTDIETRKYYMLDIENLISVFIQINKPTHTPAKILDECLACLAELKTEQVLIAAQYLLYYIDTVDKNDYSEIIMRVIKGLAELLLTSAYNTSNQSIEILAILLQKTFHVWLDPYNPEYAEDGETILNWLQKCFTKASFNGCHATSSYASLVLTLLKNGRLVKLMTSTKNELFDQLLSCFSALPLCYSSKAMEKLGEYMLFMNDSSKDHFISKLAKSLNVNDMGFAEKVLYLYCITTFSSFSKTNLTKFINSITSFNNDSKFSFYVEKSLRTLVEKFKCQNKFELLETCKFTVLEKWYLESVHNLDSEHISFELKCFGFQSMENFVESFYVEISALHFSYQIQSENVLKLLTSIMSKTESELIRDSLPLIITLAYSDSGSGDQCCSDIEKSISVKSLTGYKIPIAYSLISFACTGDLSYAKAQIEECFKNSLLKDFILFGNREKFNNGIGLQIHTVKAVFSRHLLLKHFSFKEITLLLLKFTSDLHFQHTNEQKNFTIRKIKFALILFEEQLMDESFILYLISELSVLLKDDSTHEEVSYLILGCVKLFKFKSLDLSVFLSKILESLLFFKQNSKALTNKALLDMLGDIIKSIKSANTCWTLALSILTDEVSDSYYPGDVSNLLKCSPEEAHFHLTFISRLFMFCKPPLLKQFSDPCSESVVKILMLMDLSDPSLNFQLWKAYYLEKYHEQYFQLPVLTNNRNNKFILDSFGSLSSVSMLIERNLSLLTPSWIRFVSECALGGLVFKAYNEIDGFKQTKEDYNLFKSLVCPLDPEVFCMLNNPISSDLTLTDFIVSKFGKSDLSYKDWMFSFWCALVTDMSHIKLISVLKSLACLDDLFVEDSLIQFFLFSIYSNKNCNVHVNLLNSLLVLYNTKDWEKKMNKVLELVELMRTASYFSGDNACNKLIQKHLSPIYKNISKKHLFEISLKVKNYRFAYMILDETYSAFDDFDGNRGDIKTLMLGLNDQDLVHCIPQIPSLLTSLEVYNFSNAPSIKRFLINNSAVDVGYVNKTGEGFLNSLIDSASYMELSSISKLLITKTQNEASVDWYSGLNNWDIPSLDSYETSSQILHSFLLDCKVGQVGQVLPQSHILKISKSFYNSDLYCMDPITEIMNMHKLLYYTSDEHQSYSVVLNKKDKSMINRMGWDSYQITLKSRIKFLEHSYINNIKDRDTIALSKVYELAKYNSLCREFRSGQAALKSAMELDQFISTELRDHKKYFQLKQIATVYSAETLWDYGDQIMPVKMLKSLLTTMDSNCQINDGNIHDDNRLFMPICYVSSKLVDYVFKSRQMLPMRIYQELVWPYRNNLESLTLLEEKSKIYYSLGNFLYYHSKALFATSDITMKQKRLKKYTEELKQLQVLYLKTKSSNEKKNTSKYFNILQEQTEQDKQAIEEYLKERKLFAFNSLEYLAKAMKYSQEPSTDILDKFCGLWFQISDDEEINGRILDIISEIETYKLLPWVNQMISKLSGTQSNFQVALMRTVKRLVYNFPYETIYHLLHVKLYWSSKTGAFFGRIEAVDSILESLGKKGGFRDKCIIPITEFVEHSVMLACKSVENNVKQFDLTTHKIGHFWTNIMESYKLPLPTVPIIIQSSDDGVSKSRAYVTQVSRIVRVSASGISRPKILEFVLSDGSRNRILLKGNDDLRQDAIMQQVFKQVNAIFANSQRDSRSKVMNIRTYEVIPMGNQAGMIQFIENSLSLKDILVPMHNKDKCSFAVARETMKKVVNRSKQERILAYSKLESQIQPVFRKYFFQHYNSADKWMKARYNYTKSLATTSVIGYVLGIGDRHLQNVMIDCDTAEILHIDFGIVFDRGKTLTIPELVPFRLTKDLVDALGIAGFEGLFRKNFERSYKLLRNEQENVMSVLNILKWDPLYSWSISPLKKSTIQKDETSDKSRDIGSNFKDLEKVEEEEEEEEEEENDKSIRALTSVEKKLNGLSVEATVQELISEATSVENLAVIFYGWSPFY